MPSGRSPGASRPWTKSRAWCSRPRQEICGVQPNREPRAIVLVLDSVGVGELPDAAAYGDIGSNTLGNIARAVGGVSMPHLGEMGLGNITGIEGAPGMSTPTASWGRNAERSAG